MKVLVIEDSERLRRALGEGLRRSGFVVDLAQDGEEGLRFEEANLYDVIVLDIMMPRVDGLTFLRRIRQKENPVNVLILSARDLIEDKVEGLELGADDYLVKPFSFDELVARIKALGRRQRETKSSIVEIDDVVLDTSRRQVFANKQPLQLTPSEFNILEQLMLRRGRVLAKSQLLDWIRDNSSNTVSNIVEVLVSNLRKKLRETGIEEFIRTKRGFGYYVE